MILAFWSNYHGQTANTSNTIVAAVNLSMKYNLKTLLFHNQYIKSNLEAAFLSGKENESESLYSFDEVGIDAIAKLINSGQLNETNINNYTTEVSKNLSLIIGSTKKEDRFKEIENQISKIILCGKAYDIEIIDLNSGLNKCSRNIIINSDVVVVSLNQNEKVLSDFFNNIPEELKNKKYIIAIGKYNPNSKFTIKYIKRVFKVKEPIVAIPYNTNYMDAHNNHKIVKFIKSLNSRLNQNDEDYYFKEQIDFFTDILVDVLDIKLDESVENKKLELKKNRLFGMF